MIWHTWLIISGMKKTRDLLILGQTSIEYYANQVARAIFKDDFENEVILF
jgi:hypothetical protein